jgi:MoxR-like ATPase
MTVRAVELIRRLEDNVGRVLVGKPEAIRLAVVGLLARGHLLIEDVPGVGKTTLAAALARSIGVGFQRIQFTSDMLPSDILGVTVWEPTRSEFVFKPGPLFTNVVLADEINRTTPKTQSSLLEAMNEAQVSLDHSTHPLPRPFMVLATQNPLEYEGTHPLPESQLDRFLLRIRIGYPVASDEKAILRGGGALAPESLAPVVTAAEVVALQNQVDRVRADESVLDYLIALVEATRHSPLLRLGVSPRGSLAPLRAARARALADGREFLVPDDLKALAVPALSHRVLLRAASGGESGAETVVSALADSVPVPR